MEPIKRERMIKIIFFLINFQYFLKVLIKGGNEC